MTLRLLQVFVPANAGPNIETILEGREALGTWRDASDDDRLVVHLLVPADETEPILDRLEEAFQGVQGFHVVLFPVSAVLPRAESVDDKDAEETSESAAKIIDNPGRVSRDELLNSVVESMEINRVYTAMTILSSVVAAVGLLQNDVAVIIGAMVIAPMLGPQVAMSLATTLGDFQLLRKALMSTAVATTLALLIAVVVGVAFPIDPTNKAIDARTHLKWGDLVLALAAGSAGTFAFTRGLANAVIGVMVAVALMPPLVACGMLLGSRHFGPAFGALLLLSANVVCINLAGTATFLAQGVRPRTWWEEEQARRSSRIAILTWMVLLGILAVLIFMSPLSE